ncbi:MAG: lasso RiPP family leader peptide-containing protein [Acidimicrobiales bacterium]
MGEYESPTVVELGTVEELTQTAHKAHGHGDFVISNGVQFGSTS